jgi:hypothetical protein
MDNVLIPERVQRFAHIATPGLHAAAQAIAAVRRHNRDNCGFRSHDPLTYGAYRQLIITEPSVDDSVQAWLLNLEPLEQTSKTREELVAERPARTFKQLTSRQVAQIKLLYARGATYLALASRFNVNPCTIFRVLKGRTHPEVGDFS